MVKEYVINSLAEFEVLDRTLMAEHEVKSRQAGSSVEREEIGIKFITDAENDSFNKHIQHFSEAYDIVYLEDLKSGFPSRLSKINNIAPKLRRLTLNVNYGGNEILSCLEKLAKFSALEEVTLDTTNALSSDCFGRQNGYESFTGILTAMRKFVQTSKQLRVFKIIDEGFTKKICEKDHAIYWKEIQDILSNRNCSIERLEKMKEALDDTRELLDANLAFFDKHPQNDKSKKTCEVLKQESEVLEQQLLEAVERVIASRDHADTGCYFKAELIQLREPVVAYDLLSEIPENSVYYLKANHLMAHILMDDMVFSQVFYPEFKEGKELEGKEAEEFTINKLKEVIYHLRLAKIEGEEKRLFGQLLTELVTGESSLGQVTPFDQMPLDAEEAIDFLLDMLREQHSKIKKLESALQDKGVSIPVREEAPRQNVLSFSPALQQKKDKSAEQKSEVELPSNSERSKLTTSQ